MGIATGSRGKPHGHDHTAILELNAMVRTCGQNLPIVCRAELIKRAGDLHRSAPAHAIVIASLIEATHVFEAEKHVYGAITVGDEDGIVVGHVRRIDAFHGE